VKSRKIVIAALVAAVIGVGLWQVFQRTWYYLPGLIAAIEDPVGPTRAVAWRQGPATASAAPRDRPPNIIVILADDLGWNDLTINGGGVAGGRVPTPAIDRIGRDGAIFTQAYAGDATCAPSRAAIMTGRYATRFGFEFTPTPVAFSRLISTFPSDLPMIFHQDKVKDMPSSIHDQAIPANERMIGEALTARGYHTLMLGKWHLGGTKSSKPDARGFAEALSFYPGASMFLPEKDPQVVNAKQDFDPIDKFLWANLAFGIRYNDGAQFRPASYMTDYLGEEAARAIVANKHRPFFMYLAYNAPHTPLQALKSDYDALGFIDDHRLRVYAAMIRALDRSVGKVLETLAAEGLEDDTLVIFTTDNGGAHYIGLPDINRPFRGWKATFFEGGIHVPFLMKWPAKIAKGSRYDRPVGHVDIFATAAAAAGLAPQTDRKMDGVDLVPYATGARIGDPHETLYWRDGEYRALLSGGWKLQTAERPKKDWLYDLATDPTEKNNLAASRPDKLAELKTKLAEIDAEQVKPIWPALLEAPIRIDRPLGVPSRPDDEYVYWAN